MITLFIALSINRLKTSGSTLQLEYVECHKLIVLWFITGPAPQQQSSSNTMLLPEVPLQSLQKGGSLPIEIKLVLPGTEPIPSKMVPPPSLMRDKLHRRNRFKNVYYPPRPPQYPSNMRYSQQRPSRNQYSFMRDYGGYRQGVQSYQEPYYRRAASNNVQQNRNQYSLMRDYGDGSPGLAHDFQEPSFRPLAGYGNAHRQPLAPRPHNSWYLDQAIRRPSSQGYYRPFFNDYAQQKQQQGYRRQFFRDDKVPGMMQQGAQQQPAQSNQQCCGCCQCQPCNNNPPPPPPPPDNRPPPPSFRKVVVNEGKLRFTTNSKDMPKIAFLNNWQIVKQ